MSAAELKPCPFCGAYVHVMTYMSDAITRYGVACMNTECPVRPSMFVYPKSREDAAKAWNTRAAVQS